MTRELILFCYCHGQMWSNTLNCERYSPFLCFMFELSVLCPDSDNLKQKRSIVDGSSLEGSENTTIGDFFAEVTRTDPVWGPKFINGLLAFVNDTRHESQRQCKRDFDSIAAYIVYRYRDVGAEYVLLPISCIQVNAYLDGTKENEYADQNKQLKAL